MELVVLIVIACLARLAFIPLTVKVMGALSMVALRLSGALRNRWPHKVPPPMHVVPQPPINRRKWVVQLTLPGIAVAVLSYGLIGCFHASASTPTLAGNAETSYTTIPGVGGISRVRSPDGQALFSACLAALGYNQPRTASSPPPSGSELQVRAACIGYASTNGNIAALNSLALANNAGWQQQFMNQYAGLGFQTGLMRQNFGNGPFANGRYR